ncbi:hypothetical protein HanIR_Chr16g0809171 [Helianthus annuus]|nr:hypothetical protein HanIR_Chr16g0809171 [Helianthus annuus]
MNLILLECRGGTLWERRRRLRLMEKFGDVVEMIGKTRDVGGKRGKRVVVVVRGEESPGDWDQTIGRRH